MKSKSKVLGVAIALASMSVTAQLTVGGSQMSPARDIIDNTATSAEHTTLISAVEKAGLVRTLKGAGPFTVFAPTNDAFEQLPDGVADGLLEPRNKAQLSKTLTYHVVPGDLDAAALRQRITAGNGAATLQTVEGEALKVTTSGDALVVTDARGQEARVTIPDVRQSNGVVHVVDKVLLTAATKASDGGA